MNKSFIAIALTAILTGGCSSTATYVAETVPQQKVSLIRAIISKTPEEGLLIEPKIFAIKALDEEARRNNRLPKDNVDTEVLTYRLGPGKLRLVALCIKNNIPVIRTYKGYFMAGKTYLFSCRHNPKKQGELFLENIYPTKNTEE